MFKVILLLSLFISCNSQTVPTPTIDTPSTPQEYKTLFIAKSSLAYIKEVAQVSNCVVQLEEFLKEIETLEFTHTDKTSKEVATSFKEFKPVVITTYKTVLPTSKVIATTYANDRTTLYFNTRRNPRSLVAMVNTAIHEASHLQGYSHGNNSSIGKEKSVPYLLGSTAEKYVERCK